MPINPDRKIIDLLNEKKAAGVKTSVSLEYFPPRTADGVKVRTSLLLYKFCGQKDPARSFYFDVNEYAGGIFKVYIFA